jgi:hypothetical protein
MKGFLLAFAIIALLSFGVRFALAEPEAPAVAAFTCQPWQKAMSQAQNAATNGRRIVAITDPDKVHAFLAVVNAEPPVTQFDADAILGVTDGVHVVFGLFLKADATVCGPVTLSGQTAARALDAGGFIRGEEV